MFQHFVAEDCHKHLFIYQVKTMRSYSLKYTLLLILIAGVFKYCKKHDDLATIKGTPGNPRFNLQFTNEQKVDLDLYVQTPNGSLIYFQKKTGQGGSLDLDCHCTNCINGPNENIYWTPGTAPAGTYKFYVKYYEKCTVSGTTGASSDYTVRVLENDKIKDTKKGTLSNLNTQTEIWTYTLR